MHELRTYFMHESVYLLFNSYFEDRSSIPYDLATCNETCLDNVIVESCDDFIAVENDELKQEVLRFMKEVTNLKGKHTIRINLTIYVGPLIIHTPYGSLPN